MHQYELKTEVSNKELKTEHYVEILNFYESQKCLCEIGLCNQWFTKEGRAIIKKLFVVEQLTPWPKKGFTLHWHLDEKLLTVRKFLQPWDRWKSILNMWESFSCTCNEDKSYMYINGYLITEI